jgi:beta-glucoside operon transcriptional antiterminator
MLALKKINNNVVICRDSKGREMIAMGKGIGFGTIPREIPLNEIERSFYDVTPQYVEVLRDLPEDMVMLASKIIDIAANELSYELRPGAVFTLADHMAFAVERARKQIRVQMPLAYDVEQMYPREYRIGRYALERLRKESGIGLPKEEIAGIALNLVNSRVTEEETDCEDTVSDERMLEEVTEIVENEFHIFVDRESFSYSRYATHLQYLFKRIHDGKALSTVNIQMFASIWEEYPAVADCVEKISSHIQDTWNCELTEEEKLYMILHVNRICIKEGL